MLKFLKMDVFHRQSRERFRRILEDDVDDHELAMGYSLLEDLLDVQPLPKKRGGSVPGRLAYRKRGRLVHHEIIMRDYFCDNPVYDDVQFRTRFRMSKRLF
jgi:hypothetical protein